MVNGGAMDLCTTNWYIALKEQVPAGRSLQHGMYVPPKGISVILDEISGPHGFLIMSVSQNRVPWGMYYQARYLFWYLNLVITLEDSALYADPIIMQSVD